MTEQKAVEVFFQSLHYRDTELLPMSQSPNSYSTTVPDWRNADPEELEPFYSKWVGLLTSEGLHAKADIATVLAMLDRAASLRPEQDDALRDALREATAIGIANLFAYCGAYESLSPHKRKQWDRLSELSKLAGEPSSPATHSPAAAHKE